MVGGHVTTIGLCPLGLIDSRKKKKDYFVDYYLLKMMNDETNLKSKLHMII